MSGISQATNLTVRKLADMNKIANVDLIYAGNTLVFEGNVVSVEDDKGETVAQTVIRPQDKNDAKKPVGKQEATNQAEEKAQETPAPSQSQTNQATNTPGTTAGTFLFPDRITIKMGQLARNMGQQPLRINQKHLLNQVSQQGINQHNQVNLRKNQRHRHNQVQVENKADRQQLLSLILRQ